MPGSIFPFAFDHRVRLPLALGAVTPRTCALRLTEDGLSIRYGVVRLQTPLANVLDARVTGPYKLWRSAGLRLSGRDTGITFGTSAGPGVCLLFAEPVRVLFRHEACTVTVADPAALVAHWRTLTGGA